MRLLVKVRGAIIDQSHTSSEAEAHVATPRQPRGLAEIGLVLCLAHVMKHTLAARVRALIENEIRDAAGETIDDDALLDRAVGALRVRVRARDGRRLRHHRNPRIEVVTSGERKAKRRSRRVLELQRI